MSSTSEPPPSKSGERQPSSTATDGSTEIGKSSQTNPGSTRPPTNAAVDAMLSVTTHSTARTSHPAEQTQDSALHTQTTDRPMEPPILLPEERNIPDTDLATILRSLVEKVDDLTRARARTDDHDSDIAQEQEEKQANQRHTRRIPAELAAQIQRNLFRDSETPAQKQTALSWFSRLESAQSTATRSYLCSSSNTTRYTSKMGRRKEISIPSPKNEPNPSGASLEDSKR
ncbi:hypothetical protein DY000_02049585 [Brassica cretica]|uniref:Uncharacterized protein n=1 Tax=Brassica cretica TaxID=69181 RepID=A0ABQ7EZC9_BRACR|nr:hypothetical protein DY000_02049585 [Brassica cretica]